MDHDVSFFEVSMMEIVVDVDRSFCGSFVGKGNFL